MVFEPNQTLTDPGHYTDKMEAYNVIDDRNLQNDYSYYGNGFVTVIPPRSYDLTFTAKL